MKLEELLKVLEACPINECQWFDKEKGPIEYGTEDFFNQKYEITSIYLEVGECPYESYIGIEVRSKKD